MTVDNQKLGGLVFWIVWFAIVFSLLIYLGIWGFQENNGRAIAGAVIFGILLIGSALVTYVFGIQNNPKRYYELGMSYGKSCFFWVVGVLVWGLILFFISLARNTRMSVLSSVALPQNALFASISGQLPKFWDVMLNSVMVVFTEEAFWVVALPLLTVFILNSLGKENKALRNPIVQFIVIFLISVLTFALFHVGQLNTSFALMFFISATVFRGITLVLTWGDYFFNLITVAVVVPSVTFGMHFANNVIVEGVGSWFFVMTSQVVGWLFLAFLAQIVFFAIKYAIKDLKLGGGR